jgi:hypothetical protein
MALNRTALRLAVIEALAPHALHAIDSGWPTLAGGRVIDTALDRAFDGWDGTRKCFVAVYIDGASRKARDDQDMARDSIDECTLGIEIALPLSAKDEDGNLLAYAPQTDAEAEAMLDLIEAQIHERIEWARMDGLLAIPLIGISKASSEPQRDPDLGVRVSARRIEYDCMIHQQGHLPSGQSGLARLPSPLREVAQRLPRGSAALDTCLRLVAAMAEPASFADLETFRIAASLAREGGSANPPAFANGEGGDKQASVTFP